MQSLIIIFFSLLHLFISLFSAGHALLNKRDPRSALGWTTCCLFIPYFGALIYVLFGINRTGVRARKKRPAPDDKGITIDLAEQPGSKEFPISIIGLNVSTKQLLPCTDFQILENGDAAYPAMLEAIEKSTKSICLASYIFSSDKTGEQFILALTKAHKRGVDVKIMVDGLGEYMSIPRVGRKIKQSGLPFKRFNPVGLVPPSFQINMRNHRKMLVIDNTLAFTGGMNIAGYHLIQSNNTSHVVQDLHFKLQGAIVADLEYAFLKDWDYCTGKNTAKAYTPPNFTHQADIWTRLILDGPNEYLDKLSDVLNGAISAAKSKIWVMTPYFLPDADIVGALQAAKLRNIDVKIVLPAKNNIHLSHWATRNTLWQFLKHNIEIYYQIPPFAHTKLIIIDDDYSLIGSANIDPRSLRLNFELSVEVFSKSVNKSLQAYFESKIHFASQFNKQDLAKRGLLEKLRDALAGLFSPYL